MVWTHRDLLPLALVAVAVGCGGPSGSDGGADGGMLDADGGAETNCLQILPGSLDFTNVGLNTTAKRALALTNSCATDLVEPIVPVQGRDAAVFATIPAAGGITVKSHQTATVWVTYSPLFGLANPSSAYLTFNAGCSNCVGFVDLRGSSLEWCMILDVMILNFGGVAIGTTVTKSVTLTNPCSNAPIDMTADPAVINIDSTGGMSASGPFQPGAGAPTYGTIGPGESIQVPVAFTPLSSFGFYGQLELRFDDATHSNVVLQLAGAGL